MPLGTTITQESFDFSKKEPKIYQVTELIRSLTQCVEGDFFRICLDGEIDAFTAHARTGHWYFSIKDEKSSISAIMLRAKNQKVTVLVKNGLTVRIIAKVSLYEPQGKLQLYVEEIQLTGDGAIRQALEELKQKLYKEGLFDEAKKRKLPLLPRRVGLVTSKSGAVLRDIVKVAFRRGKTSFLLAPCAVQGDNAPLEIKRSIEQLQPLVDVIIVARGGGSSSDLNCFNDERVVRAIASSDIPIVSAVGHEVDTTLADLAADVRASTPSVAAELVIPVYEDSMRFLTDMKQRLYRYCERRIVIANQSLDLKQSQLFSLGEKIINSRKKMLLELQGLLNKEHPKSKLIYAQKLLSVLYEQLENRTKTMLEQKRLAIANMASAIDALSPLQVLARGYAIVTDDKKNIVKNSTMVQKNQSVHIRLEKGTIDCQVLQVNNTEEKKFL